MAREWTAQQKQMLIKGAGAIALVVIIFLAISLLQDRGPERCSSVAIASAKDECWKKVAAETGNPAYCKNITSISLQDQCIAALMTSQGIGDCAQLSEAVSRDYCYSRMAKEEGNEEYCARITTDSIRDSCYLSLASSLSSPSLCGMASSREAQIECSNSIYYKLAEEQKNASMCRNMMTDEMSSHSQIVDSCILNVATSSKDVSLCAGISNSTIRAQCEATQADFEYCESLTEESTRTLCFYNVATAGTDPGGCEMVPSQSVRDNCYYQFATRRGDILICDKIAGDNLRSVCRSGLGG